MDKIAQRLKAYIDAHPFDPGDSDCETVLDQLYQAYAESHESDPQEISEGFKELEEFLCNLPLDDNNAVFNRCCRLCIAYERKAFMDGLQYGAYLIHFFSCSNYKSDTRGSCETRHYIRADAIEQVVMWELQRMAAFLRSDEDVFAELLAQKTNADMIAEKKYMEAELQRSIARNNKVAELFEKLYEDNVEGKVTDEWFLQLSHKYEVERMELKEKIAELRGNISDLDSMQTNKDQFIHAIRKFMEMQTLTAPLLRELIDHIDVYETEGTGKNRTQRVMIHYKFVGVIEIPDDGDNYTADTRKGVAVEYVTKSA